MGANLDREPGVGTCFALPDDDEAKLRALAADVLRVSFERLAEARVLPRSAYRPWMQGAREYFGHDIAPDEPLAAALDAALPERFARGHAEAMDYPWGYSHALVEGAVAAATLAEEPYEVTSPSVQESIDHFMEKITAPPATTVLQVVTDVDVLSQRSERYDAGRAEASLRVGQIDIIRVGDNAERYIERELKSAGYDVERDNVINTPGPTSLLVSRVCEATSINARSRKANERIQCLTTAIRLATGATLVPLVTIEGEPGMVRTASPRIQPHTSQMMRLGNRAASLEEGDAAGIDALVQLVGKWRGDDPFGTNPLQLAVSRLNRSSEGRRMAFADVAIDLSIGLEAAFSEAETSEVGLRLRTRAADLLSTEEDPADRIYQDVKQLYQLRSAFVHGRALNSKRFAKAVEGVSSAGRSQHLGERIELVLDRWRDILRRAILARAALSANDSFWPFGANVDVEREWRRRGERERWQRQIRGYWADVGLPAALEPAEPWRLRLSPANEHSSGT